MSQLVNENLFTADDLMLAWERVNASVGTDSKDYFGISVYSQNLSKYLEEIYLQLVENKYTPNRAFKYFQPKKGGTQRTKTVLQISDAIVYQAIADKIASKLFNYLSETRNHTYGSVLNENVLKGTQILEEDEPEFYFFEYYVSLYNRFVEGIGEAINSDSVTFKLETDITGFFDCIPHSTLILELNNLGIQKELLDLLAKCLNFWSGTRDEATFYVGIPQGPAASFLLANIVLDSLDRLILDRGLKYFRFMDDIRVYGSNEQELLSVLALVDRHLKGKSLSINAEKTAILPANEFEDGKDIILDSSGIPLDERIEDSLEQHIVIQDHTQLSRDDTDTRVIPSSGVVKVYLVALKLIEDELIQMHQEHRQYPQTHRISKKDIQNFLTLSQRWRTLVRSIQSTADYSPNQGLVRVWLFGIRRIFWKANSMVWNLNCYDSLESHYDEFENILFDFERFEWVKYQVLNVYGKVIGPDLDKQKKLISDLKCENSPLVRLGYYSVLVDAIRTDSDLFDELGSFLKKENEEYVRESVLSLIHRQHLNISIDNLKDWFL